MTSISSSKVSLCLIVRNEEQNLPRCLDSVRDLVHEIVVVDTGSTDRTREIAQQYGARLVEMTWCDDFSAARNAFLEQATGDWILWMDADDVLPANQREPLRELLASLDNSPRVYFFWVNSPGANADSSANVLTQARLFRADSRLRWTRRVHEQIVPACERLGYGQQYTDIQIQHLGYKDAALFQRKVNRDLRLLRMEYATDPQNAGTLLYLGLNLMKTGKHAEALGYLLRAYQVTRDSSRDYVAAILSLLVECLLSNGQFDQACNICAEALQRFPLDQSLVLQQAQLLFKRHQNTTAIHLLRDSLARPQVRGHFFGDSELFSGRTARSLLARIYAEEQRFEDAERLYQELLSEDPTNAHLWGYLGALYLAQKRYGDLQHSIQQLEKCPQGTAVAEVLKGAVQFEQGNFAAARHHCEQAILHDPQSFWARAVLCQTIFQQQDPDGQLENALRDLLRLDPQNEMANGMLQEVLRLKQLRDNQWSVHVNM